MSRLIAGVQPLILTQAGQMPTIPTPSTIMPDDSRFNKELDLMVGQLAYNVVDDEWYYRGYSSIQTLLKASTITVGQVEAWQSDKAYKAGNVFVSFVNPSSPDEQFQSEAIYRCKEATLVEQSPETHPEKWVYQGQNVTVDPTTVIETITIETASSYNPTKEGGYTEGSIVSYKNESSPDPQFQTLELYLANSDIPQGVSPEDSTEWIFKGQEIVEQITYPTVRVKASISTMQAITNNVDGDITIIRTSGEIYEFDSEATSGVKPDNVLATDPGRWVLAVPHKVGEAPTDGQQYARKDGGWEAVEAGDTSKWEDESATLIRPKDGKKVDASHIEGFDEVTLKAATPIENNIKIFDSEGNDKDSEVSISDLSTNQTIPFNQILPFDHVLTMMEPHNISGDIHFSGDATNIVNGSKVIVVLRANGSNIPTFSSQFKASADSLQYNNIPNEYNTIEFLYDGLNFWYKINNTATSNLAYKSEVLLKTNETAYTPVMDYNPSTKKYVDDYVRQYVANYYPGIPTPSGQELGYYGIRWNSAYPNSGCLRTGTLSGYHGGGYFNEPAYALTHRPLSNVPNNLLFIQNKIRRCIANVDGTINYYLDPNNSYNKYGELPTIFGSVTAAGRTSLFSNGTFTLTADNYVGKYIHVTTSGKANIYAMVTAKVSDNQLTVIDPRRNVTTGNIFEIGDTFELCTAVLDGSDGDVMVQIPKFYQRYTRVGTENTLDISLYPYTGFNVHPAFVENAIEKDYILYSAFGAYLSGGVGISRAEVVPTTSRTRAANRNDAATKGVGWAQEMFWYRSAIQVLFFVEYADLNSDFRLPAFQHRSGFSINDIRYTGRTLFAGDNSVSIFQDTDFYDTDISLAGWTENDCVGMSYRGIENFYGSLWNWTDGINLDSGQVYITNNKSVLADDTAVGYDNPNLVWLQQTSFIRQVHPLAGAFIPSLGGGSASTYFCDQNYYSSGWRVVFSGGGSSNGFSAGAVCWIASYDSSRLAVFIGFRLCF